MPERARAARGADARGRSQVSSLRRDRVREQPDAAAPDDPLRRRASTRSGARCPGWRSRSSTPRRGEERAGRRGRRALLPRLRAASRATTRTPSRRRRRSTTDGWFHTGDLGSARRRRPAASTPAGSRTCSRSAARTSRRSRSRATSPRHPAVNIAQVVAAPDARYDGGAGRVRRSSSRARRVDRGGADRLLRRPDRDASRCRATSASSTEWPMSGTKIQKFVLRERIADELDAAGITEAPRIDARSRSAETAR